VAAGHAGCAEVADGLAGVLRSSKQNRVGSGGSLDSELIESDNLSAFLEDSSAGSFGDSKRANSQLGDGKKSDIVGDGSDDDGDLVFLAGHEFGQAGQRQGRSIDPAHRQTLEDDSVEVGTRASGQESVQLHKKLDVHVLRLGRRAAALLGVMLRQVNPHFLAATASIRSGFGSAAPGTHVDPRRLLSSVVACGDNGARLPKH